jgi:hypothetical protein
VTLLSGCALLNLRRDNTFSRDSCLITGEIHAQEAVAHPILVVAFTTVNGGAEIVHHTVLHEPGPYELLVRSGNCRVFAFEDADQNGGYTAPEKKFVYLPDQLPKYYSKSELGRSYSFWLPWDEVGGPERKLCLIARFEPRKGTPVISQPCHKLLPGTPPAPGQPGSTVMSLNRNSQPGDVRQVSYEAPAQTPQAESATTFTIDVPPSFARRSLSAASQQADEQNRAAPPPESPPAASSTSRTAKPVNAHSPTAQASESRTADSLQNAPAGASPSDRYARSRYPALRAAALRSATDHVRRQPLPATLQSRLPPTPRSDRTGEAQESPPTGEPPSR